MRQFVKEKHQIIWFSVAMLVIKIGRASCRERVFINV